MRPIGKDKHDNSPTALYKKDMCYRHTKQRCENERHKPSVVSKRQQFGRQQWLEFNWNNTRQVVFLWIVGFQLVGLCLCRGRVDHLLCRYSRQHDRVGGARVAPKSFADRHSAVRRVSGCRRHWSDADPRLGRGLWRLAEKLAFRSHPLQVTVLGAMGDDELFHMDFGRSVNWQVSYFR